MLREYVEFWVRLTIATCIGVMLGCALILLDANRTVKTQYPPSLAEVDRGLQANDVPLPHVWFVRIDDQDDAHTICRDHLYGVIAATETEPEYYVCVPEDM